MPISPRTRLLPLGATLALALSACAPSAPPVVAPAPAPGTPTAPVATPPRVTAPPARESAPPNWHRLDLERDGVLGVGSDRAVQELLAGRRPGRKVIVAVIDGGVDTAHALLAPNLWRKPGEIAGNGRDDDGNGYVDDTFGWNYIGGADGKSVHYDTFEITRLYAACKGLPAGQGIPKPEPAQCSAYAGLYGQKRAEVSGTLGQIQNLTGTLTRAETALKGAIRGDSLTVERVRAFNPTSGALQDAKRTWLQLADNGLTGGELQEAKEAYESQFKFGLDTMFNPRTIVGSGAAAQYGRVYGNRDVTGPDASHGTHVAGIIGAARGANGEVQGLGADVAIMGIRTVPNGDERDEDVASAIRYAADNGAHIINMSFGKGYSPGKAVVDSAVRYAESKGVLLVHAAGNDADDLDVSASFPSPVLTGNVPARTWLEVGASSWRGGAEIPATFSNHGTSRVDLFAPGVDILSTLPGGKTGPESGTSMAAPVVSGVAALLMSYFPQFTAADVRALLVESSRKLGDVEVVLPGGSGGRAKFSVLSKTGGVIDAFAAVKLALERERRQ